MPSSKAFQQSGIENNKSFQIFLDRIDRILKLRIAGYKFRKKSRLEKIVQDFSIYGRLFGREVKPPNKDTPKLITAGTNLLFKIKSLKELGWSRGLSQNELLSPAGKKRLAGEAKCDQGGDERSFADRADLSKIAYHKYRKTTKRLIVILHLTHYEVKSYQERDI